MNIGTLTVTLGVNADALNVAATRMSEFAKKTNAVNQRIRTIGYLTSAVITAPMVAAGRASFNMAKEYEYSMQKIVGLTGTSQQVVDKWGASIKAMAREFGKSPQEIADALYFIASSGIASADALDVLRVSVKAAAAGLGQTADIANYLTSVLNAYRGTGVTATYATDVLVAAVREGKAEASGFAAAMGGVIPIASKLGVEIDQVAGAMAAITLTGSTAAQAGVYLKNIFNALYKEADKGQKAMTSASLALDGMNTSYADLRKILRDQGVIALVEKIRVLTSQYGETLVSQVFPEIRAMTGMMSLMGKNFAYNSSIMKEVTESSGSLAEAFNKVSQTIKIRYDRAVQSVNVSLIELGQAIATTLIPIFERFAKWLDKVVDHFNSLTEEQKRFRLIIAAVIAATGPLLLLISSLGYGFTGLVSMGGRAIKILAGLARGLGFTAISAATAEAALAGTAVAGEAAAAGATAAGAAAGAAGISAGAAATSFIAFGAAMGVFGLAVWMVVENAIKPLVQKIKAMRDEYKATMDLVNGTDVQMELDASISAKRFDISKLSKDSLEALKIDIQQRLALEREDLDNARLVNEEKLKASKEYQDKLAAIQQKQKDWEWIKQDLAYSPLDLNNAFYAYQEAMQKLEKERDDYVKNGMQMAEYDKIASESIISYYEKVAVEVDAALKKITGPIEQAAEELEKLQQQSEEVNSAFFDLMIGESAITKMSKLLGGSYDDLTEKTQLYKGILERLVEIEAKAGYSIPWVTEKIDELVKKLAELEQAKISRDLQNIAGLGNILGNSFSANADAAEVLKQALIDFNINTRGTSGAFSAMGIQGKILQNVLDGLITRWQNYTIAATVEDTERTVGFLKAQRDAFQTLDSEIAVVSAELEGYQRYMEVLYATNRQGSAEWLIMAERIKKAQLALQALQSEGKIAPLEAMVITFGRFEDKITLAAAQMDFAKDRMDLLVSQGKQFTKEYYEAADAWAYFKSQLASLQDNATLSFAKEMFIAFKDSSHAIDLINARIEVLSNRMKDLAEMKPFGWEGDLKKIAEQIDQLSIQADTISTLESAFTDLFTISKDKFEDFGSWMLDWLTSLGESLSRVLAEFVAKKLVGSIVKGLASEGEDMAEILASVALGKAKSYEALAVAVAEAAKVGYPALLVSIPSAVAAVVGALGTGAASMAAISGGMATTGFKEGGVVPAGFPNDTFPAMLTSGEIILPPDKAAQFADEIVNKKKKEKEAALKIPKMQHGGEIPPGYPNDTYPAMLSSGETVLPKKLDFTGFAFGFEKMQRDTAGAIRAADTLSERISNFFADMATGMLTWGFQFRRPRAEEIEAGRAGWKERVPLVAEAATYGMLDEMTGKLTSLIPDAVKAVKNIPGLGKAAPDLGYHALLDKNHWAWNPKKVMSTSIGVGGKEMVALYAEAAANRLMPIINKTPLILPVRKVAETAMRQGGHPFRDVDEMIRAFTGKLKYLEEYKGAGGIVHFPVDDKRNLVKLYLYGDETGFKQVSDDVFKIDLGERYNKLYPNAKSYFMDAVVPHGEPIVSKHFEHPDFNYRPQVWSKMRAFEDPSENVILPLDDIGGHLQTLTSYIEDGVKKYKVITQDIWKFNPADYVKRQSSEFMYDPENAMSYMTLMVEKQAGLLDKVGKPFYLVQNNPIDPSLVAGLKASKTAKAAKTYNPKSVGEFDAAALRAKIEKMTETDWADYLRKGNMLPTTVGLTAGGLALSSHEAAAKEVEGGPGRKYPEVFKIIDQRNIDTITEQPVSPYSKLHGSFDLSFVEEVVRKALARGIDPFTALAIPHVETGGTPSGSANPFAVNYENPQQLEKLIADPIGASLDILRQKLKLADKLGYDTYAKMVQMYNGMGTLTQGAVGGKKAYGIAIPDEGIRMKENPLYGKRVEDVRNNILMQNEELVSFVESLMKSYGQPTLPTALFKTPEPIPPEYVQPISTDTTVAITSAADALQQLITSLGVLDSTALSTADATAEVAAGTGKYGNVVSASAQGIGSVVSTAIQGGDVGKAAVSSLGSLLPSLLSLIPGVGPILQLLLGGLGGGIFTGIASKMAKGGLVPSGYPNDSYPALLSSGEVVLPKEYRDMPDMLAHLTKQGSIPSGSISDELQLLLSTYEINFPEEKFKSLFAPLMKRPTIPAEQALNTRKKYITKISNVNNYTNSLTKITKDQATKSSALTKQIGQISKVAASVKGVKIKDKSSDQFASLIKTIKESKGKDKSFDYLNRISKATIGYKAKDRVGKSAANVFDTTKLVDRLGRLKKVDDKSLAYLTKISRGTEMTEKLLAGADYYPQVARMAGGGQVPSGYPNDSFPAMLSSGEYVLPKNVQRNIRNIEQKPQKIHIELGGKVLGKDLGLILRRITQYQ